LESLVPYFLGNRNWKEVERVTIQNVFDSLPIHSILILCSIVQFSGHFVKLCDLEGEKVKVGKGVIQEEVAQEEDKCSFN
jgi:hypothetical protein